MLFITVLIYIFSFIIYCIIMLLVLFCVFCVTLVAESAQIHIEVVLGVSMITSVPVLQM